jgi:hypothetical protein
MFSLNRQMEVVAHDHIMVDFQLEVFTLLVQQTAEQITVFCFGEYP